MDELQLLREIGDETPVVAPPELARQRAKLTHAVAGGGRHIISFATAAAGLTALAAAAAVAVVLVGAPDAAPRGPAATDTATDAGPVTTNVAVTQVLDGASAWARADTDVIPKPGQYYYSKWAKGGTTYESWRPVDGTGGALMRYDGGEPVRQPCPKACSPVYDPGLPTDADAMLAHLRTLMPGGNPAGLTKFAENLMRQYYLRPPVRAALFQALGRIEGVRAEQGVTDPAGRTGVGITWTVRPPQGVPVQKKPQPDPMFIFDPTTYAYLGSAREALIAAGIVERAGQLP